jgi:signal transduction histidine kinase
MNVQRPVISLPRPWRWRLHLRPKPGSVEPSTRRTGTEEDIRILGRTRLRLMAVSGVVTLVILVGLGLATYTAVSNLIVNDSVGRLRDFAQVNVSLLNQSLSSPQGRPPSFERTLEQELGTRYFGVYIYGWVAEPGSPPQRFVWTQANPLEMPFQDGVTGAGTSGVDIRDVVTSKGVPLRVYTISGHDILQQQFYVQTAYDREQELDLLALLRIVLIGGSALAFLAALVAGYLYAGRAMVPIRASIDRRQAALQRQREFAANASHELRTPLTVIRASVEDLKRNPRSKVSDVGEALGDIDAEVRHMTALVEDMLLLARTDSGVVQLDRTPLDLSDVAAEAVSVLTTVGQERGVKVLLDPLPAPISGDPLRLHQLVTILVDNAIRHSSPAATVTVWVRPEPGGALLQVDDHGPGVKPDDLPRLFERFWRADDAPAGGTGLGLAIAKWIVEQHGGTIGVFNRPEGGASFWARLPDVAVVESAGDGGPWNADPSDQAHASETPAPPQEWRRPGSDVAPEAPIADVPPAPQAT